MKKIAFFSLFLSLSGFGATDDSTVETSLPANAAHLSVGTDIDNFGGNFGMGVNVTSPWFLNGHYAVRLSAAYSFFDGIPANQTTHSVSEYTTLKLGMIGGGSMLNSLIRLYGGGGVAVFLPGKALSGSTSAGGYGGFGFEFFFAPRSPSSFYIELGGMGGGTAERYASSPSYAAGFTAAAGSRFYF